VGDDAARARRIAGATGYVATELAKEAPYYAGAFGAALVSDSVSSGDAIVFWAAPTSAPPRTSTG